MPSLDAEQMTKRRVMTSAVADMHKKMRVALNLNISRTIDSYAAKNGAECVVRAAIATPLIFSEYTV